MYVPQTVEGLTPDWLTGHLRDAGAIGAARVTSINTAAVNGFGMTGEVSRLLVKYVPDESTAPASLVVKLSLSEVDLRTVVHSMGFYEREVNFYTLLAPRSPVRVPKCYFAWVNSDSGESLLLLEDLSALRAPSSRQGVSVAEAEAVLRQIASLHARWWADEWLRTLPWLTLKGMAGADQVGPAFESQWNSFLDKLSVPLTEEILDVGRYAGRYLPAASAYLYGAAPITLVHNDVQGDNILLDRNEAVLLDWQLATIGRAAVDVAYFLGGYLDPEAPSGAYAGLIETYHARLVEGGVSDYSLEECRIDCRLALLPAATRLATAVGIHPGLQPAPGAFWNHVFPRYARGLAEMQVFDLCAAGFG